MKTAGFVELLVTICKFRLRQVTRCQCARGRNQNKAS